MNKEIQTPKLGQTECSQCNRKLAIYKGYVGCMNTACKRHKMNSAYSMYASELNKINKFFNNDKDTKRRYWPVDAKGVKAPC